MMQLINWNLLQQQDKPVLDRFNKKYLGTNFEIKTEITFEPFYGNPENAKIFFLALNPGYKEQDIIAHQNPEFLKLVNDNLNFRNDDFPYYYFRTDKVYENFEGFKWSKRIFKELISEVEADSLSKAICFIQFHGYHSSKFHKLDQVISSQKVTFDFIRRAIQLKLPIVMMRAKLVWYEALPELKDYAYLIFLKNPRKPTISKNNMVKTSDYYLLLDALRK